MIDFLTAGKLPAFDVTVLWTNGLKTVAVLIICWVVSRLIKRAIKKAHSISSKFDALLIPVMVSGANFLVYTVGAIIVLDIFGVNTNSVVALLGAAGLAVALAMKDTLQNIAAGVMLLLLRPFTIGDFIESGSIAGTIKEVHVFTSILETPDGIYISAPNSVLWGNTIKNMTRNDKRRLEAVVGISYGDSIDTGIAVLQQIIREEPRILAEPAPMVMVKALEDSAVTLQIRAWTSTPDFWAVSWDINRIMKEKVEAAGLTIPFPQRDINLIQVPAPE